MNHVHSTRILHPLARRIVLRGTSQANIAGFQNKSIIWNPLFFCKTITIKPSPQITNLNHSQSLAVYDIVLPTEVLVKAMDGDTTGPLEPSVPWKWMFWPIAIWV